MRCETGTTHAHTILGLAVININLYTIMKIKVDRIIYPSKKKALDEMFTAMLYCDGSEADRMSFAYCAISKGYTDIDTYNYVAK